MPALSARYYCNNYNGSCGNRGLYGGGIAGVVVGAAFLLMLLLCCCALRTRRARFQRAGPGMQGRQFGPMYFPTPAERTGSMGPGGPGMTGAGGPGMAGHGTTGHATTGHGMAEARGGAPMSMPIAQPAAPIQDQTEGDLPSPPPVYQQQGRFQPPTGPPPATHAGGPTGAAYAPPAGPPPTAR